MKYLDAAIFPSKKSFSFPEALPILEAAISAWRSRSQEIITSPTAINRREVLSPHL
jgi:hypothetical protein